MAKLTIRCLVAASAAMLASAAAAAGHIDGDLQNRLRNKSASDEVAVIVQFERPVMPRLQRMHRRDRLPHVVRTLKDTSARTLPAFDSHMQAVGGRDRKRLWAINAVALKVPASRVVDLARLPGVVSVRHDSLMQAPAVTAGEPGPAEWNIGAVRAGELWSLGHTGNGIVVANMDTGVDLLHPDLGAKYRGGANSWFDPHGEYAAPNDVHGHGTQTMGIMVGGSASGLAIGIAPEARWIAFRQYNSAGQATLSQIHEGFQWLLDPDGNTATDDAPHVVNASWGLVDNGHQCITEFDDDIRLLKEAGIAVVFAAGNDGPTPGTSVSPANNPQGFAVGAVDETLAVAMFSSRGPSSCDGSVYPALAAPGVNINTSDLSFGGLPLYMNVAGTSYSAPHTAGAMALLMGAAPDASVAELEAALRQSAHDLGVPGGDNDFGQGLLDVRAAYDILSGGANDAPQITSTPVTLAIEGSAYEYAVTATDPDSDPLVYSLTLAPAGMAINAASGAITWTPSMSQAGNHAVSVRATDVHGLFDSQSFSVAVANVNRAPVAASDAYAGTAGVTLNVGAPGVLGNDSDADGEALAAQLEAAPSSGSLALASNGGFSFTPAAGFAGAVSFAYRARDPNGALSASTNVTITVAAQATNRAPIAVADSATAAVRRTNSYAAVIVPVLRNDSDPDTAADPNNRIDPATLRIVSSPDRGGSVSVVQSGANAGSISYRPKRDFVGTERFTYRVSDTRGARSNVATVTVSVGTTSTASARR